MSCYIHYFISCFFLLTHIVYLSSSVHIGLDFYTGCIAFFAVDVHKYLTGPPQVDAKGTSILPKAVLAGQSPRPSPPGAQFRAEVASPEGLQVVSVLLPGAVQVATPSDSQNGTRTRWVCEVLRSNLPPLSSPGPNPSQPLSSSILWAGHQCRSCPPPCGHPHPEDGRHSLESSGAELLPTSL